MKKVLNKLVSENLENILKLANFGLEKENIRVNSKGELSLKKHPAIFKEDNPYISRDFSESQVEMITPVCNSIDEAYDFMENLNNIVNSELGDEYLWPQSNPPILPADESLIPVAQLEDLELKKYREELVTKYGAKKQLISGVHFNFSFKDEVVEKLYELSESKKSFKDFKDEIYFKIGRNFLRYKWFLNYLTGASPVFHETYIECCVKKGKQVAKESYKFDGVPSVRNSACGYKNKVDFFISHKSPKEYVRDIKMLVDSGEIQAAKEYYSSIRFKNVSSGNSLDNLLNEGVQYIEVRILDLDPTSEWGISKDSLKLMYMFLLLMLFDEDVEYSKEIHEECIRNSNKLTKNTKVVSIDGKEESLEMAGLNVIGKMEELMGELFPADNDMKRVIEISKERFRNPEKTLSSEVIRGIEEKGYVGYAMEIARKSKEKSLNSQFKLAGYEDLELSTQILIRDAIKRGIKFTVLDRKENFIELNYKGHVEYVKQATKTGKDTYITALLMENKLVTKKVLADKGINVPLGDSYTSELDAKLAFYKYKNEAIVVKPNNTNFGIGISIFKNDFTKEDFEKAVDIAFAADSSILVEKFVEGKEYRFLVMDDKLVGILHRVPANVVGDGISTIRELVQIKNQDPLRGKGYKTPLEKINLGEVEEMFLKNTIGKDFSYVPKVEEVVYLRENSNISTGGDSLDFTDEIDESYKEIAIEAAKAVGAKITGADIMIKDIKEKANSSNHAIIEMNFNPAIHIHCFPYKGKNRFAGERVLDLLFGETNK
ncbi:MAG: bifunctional glutamate--cysteine ligase GshA/glutathione synthetase GshB [Sarcina sp.]